MYIMYKFQSDKPNKQRTIDGFLSAEPRRSRIAPPVKASSESVHHTQPILLDDFKRPDGFRGRSVPRLDSGGAIAHSLPNNTAGRAALLANIRDEKIKKPAHHRGRKILLRSLLILVVLVLCVGGFLFGKAWWTAHKVFKGGGSALAFNKNIDPHLLNGEGDGRVNILLMGKGGVTEAAGGDLTDSMMIASIDPINMKLSLLSIPRDLWVKPSGLWPMKINAVYTSAKGQALAKNPKDTKAAEAAGIAKTSSIVEQYLGVHMNYYAMIDFSAFQEAVDTLGGIDVTLSQSYSDPTMLVGDKLFYLPAGTSHLDGGHALAYARSRHGAARGDFDRGEQQQQVIVGIKDKSLSLGTFANPVKVSQLLDTFGSRVQTNLSIDDMMRVYGITKQLNNSNISHFDLAETGDAVVTTGAVGDQSVVMPKAGVDNYDAVRAFVRSHLVDGFIAKENASIIVLNGTSQSGLAQKRADELKGYGYNVIQVADAPVKNATSTQLVDNTKGVKKYTKHYLEQRLGTTAVSSIKGLDLSAFSADFIIITGPQG